MGATEAPGPPPGATHPFLPLEIQRDFAMPHATSQLDWELSKAITTRLRSSSSEICFSCANQNQDVETRPSRLITQLAGIAQPLPAAFFAPNSQVSLTVFIEDDLPPSFHPGPLKADLVFSPSSRSALSKPSLPCVLLPRVGNLPRLASPPRSAANCSTLFFMQFGPGRRSAFARSPPYVLSQIAAAFSKVT